MENKTNFYPDVKPHISPSALSAWHRQKSAFVKSYFKGERTPETPAMKAGTKIHGLIEAGFLEAVCKYNESEAKLKFNITKDILVYGKPDSHETTKMESAFFVDYKTGKENNFTKEKLAIDLKMKTTAWLVWKDNDEIPKKVIGIIEWIATEWNGEELVPKDQPHEFLEVVYSAEELKQFEEFILKTIDEINEEYPKFLESSDDFINEDDCKAYADLEVKKKALEEEQKVIKERILDQMSFGGVKSFKHELGTFSVTERKTYEYPDELEFATETEGTLTFKVGNDIVLAMSVVKKNYELNAEPKSVSRSIGFRLKK